MARPPKGKPLTMRTVRLDDEVWAECQRLGKLHGTINEGLRGKLLPEPLPEFRTTKEAMEYVQRNKIPAVIPVSAPRSAKQSWKRGPRPKGDKTR